MKTRIFSIAALMLVFAAGMRGQTLDSPTQVAVDIESLAYARPWSGIEGEPDTGSLEFSLPELSGMSTLGSGGQGVPIISVINPKLTPGKTYILSYTAYFLAVMQFKVKAPPGFVVELDRIPRTVVAEQWAQNDPYSTCDSYSLRVAPAREGVVGRSGTASSIAAGKIYWQVSLGWLRNGDPAQALAIIDAATGSNWNTLFTPAGLTVQSSSDEIITTENAPGVSAPYVAGELRQVATNDAYVDVIPASDRLSYDLKFYNRATAAPQGIPPYTFGGNPYVAYTVARNGGDTKLKITRRDYDANGTVERTSETTLERTGTSPDFVWTLEDWHTSGAAAPVVEQHTWSANATGRKEVVTKYATGGAPSSHVEKQFHGYDWGEELVQVKYGTSDVIEENISYHTTIGYSYARPRARVRSGGAWEAFEYSGYGSTIKRRFRPFGDTVSNPPSADDPTTWSSATGEVTSFTYDVTSDHYPRVSEEKTEVNGTTVAHGTTSYSESTVNGMTLVTATRSDYPLNTGSALTTTTKYYRETEADSLFRNKVHSITRPDQTRTSYAYQRGTFDPDTGAFTVGSSGASVRVVSIVGTTGSGTTLSSVDGYTIDPVNVVTGKSTKTVAIRDEYARLRRTETHAWSGTDWVLVGWTKQTYDHAHRLTETESSNGSKVTTSYCGDLMSSRREANGVLATYTPDAAGRADVATIASATGGTVTVPELQTKYTYNADGLVLTETVGQNLSEKLITTRTYDDAGRLRSETPPGLGATTYAYDVSNRTKTVTQPDGSTRIEAMRPDGRIGSVTGTGVVAEYYSYDKESDGRHTAQVNIGSSGSARWRKTWTDGLGRTTRTESPGFSATTQPNFVTEQFYDSTSGLHWKTARTGYAPTRFEYDALGQLVRSGIDIGDNGLVRASSDRITDANRSYEQYDSAWWLREETSQHAFFNQETTTAPVYVRQRLTGFTGNKVSETQSVDAEGNVVTRAEEVDRQIGVTTVTTSRPGMAAPQTDILVNGVPVKTTGHDGLSAKIEYDSLWRIWRRTDTRGLVTTTAYYSGSALVSSETDPASAVTQYGYTTSGQLALTQNAAGYVTRYQYDLHGRLLRQWGSGAYPVEYEYDSAFGDRIRMKTYRGGSGWDGATWPGSPGTPDFTRWVYDGPSGLLKEKYDAANLDSSGEPVSGAKKVSSTYNSRGQTASRVWARNVTSTYGYDADTGELTGITYSDSTPAVGYTYTRLGQVDTAADSTGTRDFVYDANKPWRLSAEAWSSFYGSRVVTPLYEGSGVVGRALGFQLGASAGSNGDLEQVWSYTTAGRFGTLATKRANNTVSRTFEYGYLSNAPLVNSLSITGDNRFHADYAYDAQRELIATASATWNSTVRTRYDYTYNALGQRETARQSGDVFGDFGGSTYYRHAYNDRGELTDSTDYLGEDPGSTSSPQLSGRHFAFGYDQIGNRTSASRTGTAGSPDTYTANALNQYSNRTNNYAHVAGTAQTASSIGVTGGTTTSQIGRQGRYWDAQTTLANEDHPAKADLTITATLAGSPALVRTETRTAYLAKALQAFTYDDDGNLTSDGVWNYAYDAENRLVSMTTTSVAVTAGFPNRTVEFKYDYLGRRVQKRSVNATASTETWRRYLYDGWNVVAEFDAPSGSSCGSIVRSYTWGLDVAGSPSAAGGVGALVQITDHGTSASYLPTYDGNGNVAALLNADSGAVAAKYEYSPFGELLRVEGSYAKANPFRFSTKFTDDETGLVYYGHRYYSPSLGRFISRDPIEEVGGLNLYGFCGNDPVGSWDILGMLTPDEVRAAWEKDPNGEWNLVLNGGQIHVDSNGVVTWRNGGEWNTWGTLMNTVNVTSTREREDWSRISTEREVGAFPKAAEDTPKLDGADADRIVTEADAPMQQDAGRAVVGRTKTELPQITKATRVVILVRGDIAAANSIQFRDKSILVLEALRLNAGTLNQKLGSAVVVVATWNTKADLDASFKVLAGSEVNYVQVSSHGGGKDARGMYLLQVPDGLHIVMIPVEGGFNIMKTEGAMSYGDLTRAAADQGFTGAMDFVHCSDRGGQSWVTSITKLQELYNVRFPVVSR